MVNNLRWHAARERALQWLGRCWPYLCALCGERAHGPLDLCDGCADELPWIGRACQHCGIPLAAGVACGECLQRPPPFVRCLSPLCYQSPIDHLVTRFKYEAKLSAGHLLSRLLAHHVITTGTGALPDLLVPMPLHWRRRLRRGFNQADVIADVLSRQLRLPIAHHGLRRVQPSPAQQGLSAAARRQNLKRAFAGTGQVAGRYVALIDDVVTTGTTARMATKALLEAGAQSVEVWSLARTP